eukprot:gene8806-11195_t
MQLTKHWAAHLDDYAIDLAWSPDGTQLAAASSAGPVSLFAAADGQKRHELPGHADGTNCLAWAPSPAARNPEPGTPNPEPRSLLASGGQDGAVKFWDATAGQHTATAPLGTAWVEHLAWVSTPNPKPETPNPKPHHLFASAGRKLTALRADATVAHAFKDAAKSISALAAQPAGGCVAASHFGGVQLWDADDFVLQKEFPYANGIHALVWSPD